MLGMSARRSIDESLAKFNNKPCASTSSRRWQPPAPPSPRILQLPKPPRRNRKLKKRSNEINNNNSSIKSCGGSFRGSEGEREQQNGQCKPRGKLEALFGQEREFARSIPIVLLHPNAAGNSPRRGKVLLHKSGSRLCRESGVDREHCSDDAKDIFELEAGRNGGTGGQEEEDDHDVRRRTSCISLSSDLDLSERCGPEDWKFQAEVLRAECNLLRMEKEVAVKRWEQGCAEMKNAVRMAHSLHSAVQTLVTGRKKIVDEKNAEVVLQTTVQNQIEALQRKLEKLQKNSEFRENELKKCANFDRQAMFLQRRLDKLKKSSKERSYSEDTATALQQRFEKLVLAACSAAQSESEREDNCESECGEVVVEEDQTLADPSLRIQRSSDTPSFLGDQRNRLVDAVLLKKRLDSLSMGMNESKEAAAQIRKEYRSMLSGSGNCSSRRIDVPGKAEQGAGQENKLCSERCKATIRKIAEQVQAETEQWCQVQEILHHVREEMEDLQKSRDFWEDHALQADAKISTLQAAMHGWRDKAETYESKVSELQSEIAGLKNEIEQVRNRHALEQTRWLDARSRLTQALVSSNSAKGSMSSATDSESDNHDTSVNGSKMGNQSSNREREVQPAEDENWDDKENSETKYMQIAKPRISNVMQKPYPSVKKASRLSEAAMKHKSFATQSRKSDSVAEQQFSGKRSNRKVQSLHSKENFQLQNKHPQRENHGRRELNKSLESMGSGKSSSGSTRSPLADIGNSSPFRIRKAIFPVSSDESSVLGSP